MRLIWRTGRLSNNARAILVLEISKHIVLVLSSESSKVNKYFVDKKSRIRLVFDGEDSVEPFPGYISRPKARHIMRLLRVSHFPELLLFHSH